ncbi:uncharacterized protein C5L36_0C06370 [Pichia kudriavzevii]|uniref:Uncharacterized protein n=2 Tax=Pichia kudriavzevii TaxID=4909 RepID=A0A2U9R5U4_PICKU|nr:uncharacterized protein C5L36_0C06370 [Pichia kudriavzevii]AWU76714.1 hypothetical protein C5L36_0C06370 [Pichia kudriavzevii]
MLCNIGFSAAKISDESSSSSDYKIKLYPDKQKLCIYERSVKWFSGGVNKRNINVESDIVDAFFTSFEGPSDYGVSKHDNANEKNETVLVLILEDQIRVYNKDKSAIVVSFPMHIKSAFPFYKGIVLGKKVDSIPSDPLSGFNIKSSMTNNMSNAMSPLSNRSSIKAALNLSVGDVKPSQISNPITESNFLVLTDMMGDPGLIVSSSTSSFSVNEELVLFPRFANNCLAATFNHTEKNISIYFTRYLNKSRNSKVKSHLAMTPRKNSKRSTSSSGAFLNSYSKIFEDEMRPYRTTSNPLSFDRMAPGAEYGADISSNNLGSSLVTNFESWNLKKDAIFTKLTTINFKSDFSKLKTFALSYNEEEALILVNMELETIEIILFRKSSNQIGLFEMKSSTTIMGLDAVKFDMGDADFPYIAILNSRKEMVLYNVFYQIFSPTIRLPHFSFEAIGFDDSCESEISFLCESSRHFSLHLHVTPKDKLVENLMKSLKYLSHDQIFQNFWLNWCANSSLEIPHGDDWSVYVITLLSMSLPERIDLQYVDTNMNEITKLIPYVIMARSKVKKNSLKTSKLSEYSLESLLPRIVLSLHIIREDLRLNILLAEKFHKISVLLVQLVSWMSWSEVWLDYYGIDLSNIDRSLKLNLPEYVAVPPDIMKSICSLFSDSILGFVTFSVVAGEDEMIDKIVTPRTYNTLRLFEIIVSPDFDSMELIKNMVASEINGAEIETYPPGIYFIYKNTIELCQKKLRLNWNVSEEELKLVGREDLLYLESERKKPFITSVGSGGVLKSTKDILDELSQNQTFNAWDGQAEADIFNVTKLIFSQDRRFYELTKLLQTSKVQTVTYATDLLMNDNERLEHQRAISARIALRTLTTPIGRGAVFNSSRTPLVTEGFPIPKMCFDTLILPDNVNVSLKQDSIPKNLLDWGYFHNGASAGLLVSKEFKGVSGSWVAFNRPPILNAQHAGFLFGLGLNGHLKDLEEWHIYNYLGPKHLHTSIGLLIGMAASLKGTMDIKMTKVLSVHVVAFLPQGSTNLNVQLPVQTAGIIGIGLVYLETQHRRMSEILLTQICSAPTIYDKAVVSEGYHLASGFALGYINLGSGDTILSTTDNHIVEKLISYGTSLRDAQTLKETDKCCSGAVIALALLFLKTNNSEIGDKLSLPKTIQLLEYIRPDILMLRCLSKNLVMWNQIEPTKKFIEDQVPRCIYKQFSIDSIDGLDSEIIPYINIISGAALSIAICFASTANFEAKKTLLYYFDILLDLGMIEPTNYDEKLTLYYVRNSRDLLVLGLSVVMAGTGDLDIMKRLRYLQGITDEYTRYGNYMATNMALGFLFLGGGQQAFNSNNNFSIAALITSIYPMFGSNNYEDSDDQELDPSTGLGRSNNGKNDLHLQALRHFWALAVENRCLIVKEVGNREPIKIDAEIVLLNKTSLKVTAPCLLPDLSLVKKIIVNSKNKYFPVEFDLSRSSHNAREEFKKKMTIYIDKDGRYKTLTLDYDEIVEMDSDLKNLKISDKETSVDPLRSLSIFNNLDEIEKDIMFDYINGKTRGYVSGFSLFDFKLELERIVNNEGMKNDEKMVNLKLIFNFVDSTITSCYEDVNKRKRRKKTKGSESNFNLDKEDNECIITNEVLGPGKELNYLNVEFIEKLKKDLFSQVI